MHGGAEKPVHLPRLKVRDHRTGIGETARGYRVGEKALRDSAAFLEHGEGRGRKSRGGLAKPKDKKKKTEANGKP